MQRSEDSDRELLREVKINVLDIECRTCFFSLQDSGESCWPERCYEWTRGATIKNRPLYTTLSIFRHVIKVNIALVPL